MEGYFGELLIQLPPKLSAVLSLVAFVTTLVVTVIRAKQSKKNLKEILSEMKARLPDYRENEEAQAQEFSRMETRWKVNEKLNELQEDGQEDVQAKIQSNENVALKSTLARLLPDEDEDKRKIYEYEEQQDNLETLLQWQAVAEDYRTKRHLPISMSLADVMEDMKKLVTVQPKKTENIEKGEEKNEKKEIIEESKQA